MANDNERDIKLGATVDKGGLDALSSALDGIKGKTTEIAAQQQRMAENSLRQAAALDSVTESIQKMYAEGATAADVLERFGGAEQVAAAMSGDFNSAELAAIDTLKKKDDAVIRLTEDSQAYKDAVTSLKAGVGFGGDFNISDDSKLAGTSSFRSISSAATILGGQGVAQPIQLFADFARLKNTLPDLASSAVEAAGGVGNLTVALGSGALAVTGILVAIKLFTQGIEAGKQVVEGAIKEQEAYQQAVATMTTAQAGAALQQVEIQRNAQLASRDVLLNSIKNLDYSNPAAIIAAQPVIDEIGKLNTQLGQSQDQIRDYSQAINSGALAANDAAEAERKRKEAIEQTTLANAQATGKSFTQVADLLNFKPGQAQGALEGAQSALSTLAIQSQSAKASIDALVASGIKSAAVSQQIAAYQQQASEAQQAYNNILTQAIPILQSYTQLELNDENRRQYSIQLSNAMTQAQQDAQKAQESYLKAVQDNADGVIAAGVKLSDATDKALQAMNASIASAQQAADDALANAQRSAADAKSDAAQTAEDARTDAQRKAQDARVQAEKDFQEKLKQIERDYQTSAETAIQERDAVALDAAQRKRDDETAAAKEDEKKKLDDINKNLAEQLQTIDRRYKEQIAQIDRRLQEQEADINRRLSEQVATARQRYSEAVAAAEQAYARELADLQTKLKAEQDARDVAYNNAELAYTNFVNYMIEQSKQLTAATAEAGGAGTGTNYVPPPATPTFASGGIPPTGRTVMVGERGPELVRFLSPARVFSAAQSRAGAGTTLNLNLNGATTKTIDIRSRQQAVREINKMLDQAGV